MGELTTEVVTIELTAEERDFIWQALYQWQYSASSKPLPFQILGWSSWDEFSEATAHLAQAVMDGAALSPLNWARVLYLTETSWASSLVGAALDFATVTGYSDSEAVQLLRSLQYKISSNELATLLFPHGGRTRTQDEIDERLRWAERMGREQQGRTYPPGL